MLKNKKIVLSSIAIIFALIVCSIFVNYTLANSDSKASTAAESGSNKTSITGLTNIDLAIKNSNDASLKASGEDKFRIVQIVPDQNKDIAEADESLKAVVTAEGYDGDATQLEDYSKTSYLWRYVYAGEYFRLAVFDGYRTIEDNMAEGAVTLTTCTVKQLNKIETDTDIQGLLNQADFIYIWADKATGANSYTASDIGEPLYNWLDAYATVNSHPLAICSTALCVDDADGIVGNNDDYRMGALAYKVMTKGAVARFDNVLVTDPDFFQMLYKEASDNIDDPEIVITTNTISDFLLKASKTVNDDGYGFLTDGSYTYFKWYNTGADAVSLQDFTDRKPSSKTDTAYLRVGMAADKNGVTTARKEWNFDNAKILIIAEDGVTSMYDAMKSINSSPANSTMAMADVYKKSENDGDGVIVWSSVAKAENSEVTGSLYSGGRDNSNSYVPSGADIYCITPENLEASMKNGSAGINSMSLSSSYFMDITTKTVSGVVTTQDPGNVVFTNLGLYARLLVQDGSSVYMTDVTCPVVKKEIIVRDEEGNEILDENGKPVTETVYSYEFTGLNPEYTYSAVIESAANCFDDPQDGSDYYCAGVKSSVGENVSQYNFDIMIHGSAPVAGFTYRESEDATGNTVVDMNVVVTDIDFHDNNLETMELDGGLKTESDMLLRYYLFSDEGVPARLADMMLDLSTAENVVNYVTAKHDAYVAGERLLSGSTTINLQDYDFIFIDKGLYNKEISVVVTTGLKDAVEAGVYMIVSNDAGDGKGSGSGSGGGGSGVPVVDSPSAGAVADIINASTYRDGADNKFRVLEIQPDYPIDLDVADSKVDVANRKFTRRSDGSAITGDYYTVPSDVVKGKTSVELAEGTEYYDFDLTKAKIAYSIEGLSYSSIELTQVSTEELIGMKEDIAATYDLVYIGGDISALDRDQSQQYGGQNDLGNNSAGYTYLGIPSFIMYYHTGMLNEIETPGTYEPDRSSITASNMMAVPYVGGTYYTSAYIPENGNDLTADKYDELISYIVSGRPIMVSDELTSVYEKMQGTDDKGNKLSAAQLLQGYWYNNGKLERKNYYLDPSTRVYDLLGAIEARKSGSNGGNILWGVDLNKYQYLSDQDDEYGAGLYTAFVPSLNAADPAIKIVSKDNVPSNWLKNKNGKIYYNFKLVPDMDTAEAINSLVSRSAHRTRMTVTKKPTTYQQGIVTTYLKTTRLQYEFIVDDGGLEDVYNYKLYVDVNRDTKFADEGSTVELFAEGSVTGGDTKNISAALDSKFFGSASWYLELTNSDGDIVATKTGLSKVVNNDKQKSKISVLQIQTMAEGQTAATWTATDALYFDITSQTAHKIAKYNIYANQTEYDNVDPKQWAVLGLHENRFGINEYNMDTDRDDYYSNLADAIADDYDINLDIVVASKDRAAFVTEDGVADSYSCLERMVEEAERLEKTGAKVEGYTKEQYKTLATTAYNKYVEARKAVEKPKKKLDDYLQGAITVLSNQGSAVGDAVYGNRSTYRSFFNGFNGNTSDKDIINLLAYEIKTGDYYMMFWPVSSKNSEIFTNGEIGLVYGKEFRNLYIAYRDAKNAELIAKDTYNTYLRRSYGKDFLKKMYSIIVLGPSEGFGNFKVDFSKNACKYIIDYVNSGGDLFFFHDSMTPYADQGAVNLTHSLLSVVGMNRYHVNLANQERSYTAVNGTMNLDEKALVNRLVTEDGTTVYVKHGITANGQLEEGILTADGDIYNLISLKDANGNTYTQSPNGLLEKTNDNPAGTDVYVNVSMKDDPTGCLSQIVLDSDETVYVMRDKQSGFDQVENVPAGNKYYKSVGLVYGTVPTGKPYFTKQWLNTQVAGKVYIQSDEDGNSGYVQGLCYGASAAAGTQGYYIPDDSDNIILVDKSTGTIVKLADITSTSNWSAEYDCYAEFTSAGNESGLVLYNATSMSYIDATGTRRTGYFTSDIGKAGSKAYVLVTDASKKKYVDSASKVQEAYFIKKDGGSGYTEISGATLETYVDPDGAIQEGYFMKYASPAGSIGYIKITDATKQKYLNTAGEITEGWFTETTGTSGIYGYVMTEAGQISYAKGVNPNAMYKTSADGEPYITNYAFNGAAMIDSMNANFTDAVNAGVLKKGKFNYLSDNLGVYVSALAMTALYTNGNMAGATNTMPYVYAQASSFKMAVEWSSAANGADYSETMKAAQLNEGLVTLYPYNISSTLNIAGTHQQAYALDLENSNTTVWYTLAGSNNKSNAKNRSSKYAASPGDGMESYYIYTTSYGGGAITYCGSGHSSVTGQGKRNNDERKLFINVIVNSANAVPESPIITCYEPTGTFSSEDELTKDKEACSESGRKIYVKDVDSKTAYPEFDYKVTVPEGTRVNKVRIFYDLDYYDKDNKVDYTLTPTFDDSETDDEGNTRIPDVLITELSTKDDDPTNVVTELRDRVRNNIDKLKLQESYFAPYGGNFTFIVIEVTYEGAEAPVYAMIKIKASDPLFDLTENNLDVPTALDYLAEKKNS